MSNLKIFNNFKIHTQYSICEGAIKIDDLAQHCKEKKVSNIGICDSLNLCGALEFAEKVSKSGTQPITGTQINFSIENCIGKLPLFASTSHGYRNLIKLSSKSYLDSDERTDPHCKIDELKNINDGLMLLSGNHHGLFGKLFKLNKLKQIEEAIKELKNTFKDRFYLEIQRHNEPGEENYENFIIKLSEVHQIPLIATQEIFYLKKDMYEAHDALICIGQKNFVDDPNRLKFSDQHFVKENEDIKTLFKDVPEALENNYNFPYRFNFKPKKSPPVLPTIKTEKNVTVEDELLSQAQIGLKNRLDNYILKKNLKSNKEKIFKLYEDRLNHEINIINSMNYPGYFLIVSDYIRWSKKNNIPVGPGRGSGAGSLVAYCLDITDVDPIEFDLIFERFLNPNRISMPDFDIDFFE